MLPSAQVDPADLMIKRKTVFVLGAGAHVPYGFPDGAGLIARLLSTMPERFYTPADYGNFSHGIYSNQPDVTATTLLQFREALNMGGHTSIDSFLATHSKRPGFVTIGKLAVAYELLPLEFVRGWGRVGGGGGDWMTYVFQSMLHGCLESADKFIAENSVSFVTFNYDRTLEDFLCTRLSYTYNSQPEDAWEKAKQIAIVHVYGSLGDFDPRMVDPRYRAVLSAEFKDERVRKAALSIRMMYDDRADHSGVKDAMELIAAAECVCFLGFGFDPDNITRLKLNEYCSHPTKGGRVFATKYKTRLGDWSRVVSNMQPATLNPATGYFEVNSINWDCLEFLHQTGALG
jgi:hypothetical protein